MQDTDYELLANELQIHMYEVYAYKYFFERFISPFCDTSLMYDGKLFLLKLKTNLTIVVLMEQICMKILQL